MNITIQCEHCRKTYNAPASMAGKRVKCKHCGQVFAIPAAGGAPGATDSVAPGQASGSAPGFAAAPAPDSAAARIRAIGTGSTRRPLRENGDLAEATTLGDQRFGIARKIARAEDVAEVEVAGDSGPVMSLRPSVPFDFPGAHLIDAIAPVALLVLSLGWLGYLAVDSNLTGVGWVGMFRMSLYLALYLAVVFPISYAAVRWASGKCRFALPPSPGARALGSFALPFALAMIVWLQAESASGLVFGVMIGAVVACAATWFFYRIQPQEMSTTFGAAAGGFAAAVLLGYGVMLGVNLIFAASLRSAETNPLESSPVGPALAWDVPKKEKAPDNRRGKAAPATTGAAEAPTTQGTETPGAPGTAGTGTNATAGGTGTTGTATTGTATTGTGTPGTGTPGTGAGTVRPDPATTRAVAGGGPRAGDPTTRQTAMVTPGTGTGTGTGTDTATANPGTDTGTPGTGTPGTGTPGTGTPGTGTPGTGTGAGADPGTERVESPFVAQVLRLPKLGTFADLQLAPHGAPFMTVVKPASGGAGDVLELWSLNPPQKKAQTAPVAREKEIQRAYALDAKGDLLAHTTDFPKLAVRVYSFSKGDYTRTIPLNPEDGTASLVGFGANDTLVVHRTKGDAHGIEVFNLRPPKPTELAKFLIDTPEPTPGNPAVSPDGRLLLVAAFSQSQQKGGLDLYDLSSSRRAPLRTYFPSYWSKPTGVQFAPDGRSVAAMFESQGRGLLVQFRTDNARAIHEHEYPLLPVPQKVAEGWTPGAPAFGFAGDGSAFLLYGRALLDADTGKPIGMLEVNNVTGQRVIDREAVLLETPGSDGKPQFVVLKLKASAIAERQKELRAVKKP